MNELLTPYAKLLTVISAVLVFGSWMVTTFLADRLSELKQGLTAAKDAHSIMERLYNLEWKMIELYQVTTTTRKYASIARASKEAEVRDKEVLEQVIFMLERTGVSRDILMSTVSYAIRLNDYINEIEPGKKLRNELRSAISSIEKLTSRLEDRKVKYQTEQEKIIGDRYTINPSTITPEQLRSLDEAVRKYRDFTEYELGPEITPKINTLFDATRKLFSYAEEKIETKKKQHRVAKWGAITIYIVATILAIYGGYLEAITTKAARP